MEIYKFENVAQCELQRNFFNHMHVQTKNVGAHDKRLHFNKNKACSNVNCVSTHMHVLMLQECGLRICPHDIVWASISEQMLRRATCKNNFLAMRMPQRKSFLVTMTIVFPFPQFELAPKWIFAFTHLHF